MENINSRIAYLIDTKCGGNKSAFARKVNITPAYAAQLYCGAREPSDRTISDICREFDVNEVWLRTGEGEPDHERTREEEIMRFAVRAARGSEGFRKQLAFMLSQLDEEDWENLEKIYQKQLDKIKNSGRN